MKLCDSHIHFIPQELAQHTSFYKGVWTDKEKLYAFIEANDIEKALLVYPSTDAHIKLGVMKVCELYNNALENILKENGKIICAGLVDIENAHNIPSKVEELKEKGFKAISLASSCDGSFIIEKLTPLFESAEIYNMNIFVHPQTINPIGFERVKDPLLMPVLEYSFDVSMFLGLLMVGGVLEKFKIKFIFSSLGGIMPFIKDRFDRVYTMLRQRDLAADLGKLPSQILKSVYVDTSGTSLKNVEMAIDLFGWDKILFGSDYPVHSDVVGNLKSLDVLGAKIKEKIAYKNFIELFG